MIDIHLPSMAKQITPVGSIKRLTPSCWMTKLTENRLYADPEAAARRILEIANAIEPAMKGRIYVELVNGPFLFRDGGSVAEYGAGLRVLIEQKQLFLHESGTFVWLPEAPPSLDDGNRDARQAELLPDASTGK